VKISAEIFQQWKWCRQFPLQCEKRKRKREKQKKEKEMRLAGYHWLAIMRRYRHALFWLLMVPHEYHEPRLLLGHFPKLPRSQVLSAKLLVELILRVGILPIPPLHELLDFAIQLGFVIHHFFCILFPHTHRFGHMNTSIDFYFFIILAKR